MAMAKLRPRPKVKRGRRRRGGRSPDTPRVYMVTGGHDEDYKVVAIFSSRPLAEAFIGPEPGDLSIDEDFCVDAMVGYRQRRVYRARVGVDGRFCKGRPEGDLEVWHDSRMRTPAVAFSTWTGVEARSAVSMDHAVMAACDAWRARGGTVAGEV